VALARAHGIPNVEDDAYGLLSLDGRPQRALFADDHDSGLYVGSLSIVLAPGLRIGWIVAQTETISRLAIVKDLADINATNVVHHAVADYFATGQFPAHLARVREHFRMRRDHLLEAIDRHFPEEFRATRPRSGIFSWIDAPARLCSDQLLARAFEEQRVLFVPGSVFSTVPGVPGFRLCYTSSRVTDIESGVARLGRVLERAVTGRFSGVAAGSLTG
jgi:DNA-binding transcriptional MocR family regulator